jgi:plasmid replication initiation protein
MALRVLGQGDLFVANIQDVRTKHARELMETNWVSLTKKTRHTAIEYKWNNEDWFIRVTNDSGYGVATIWDFDVILFALSQLTDASNRGETIGSRIWFSGGEFLSFIGRSRKSQGGRAYDDIWAKLNRLHTTHVHTNIRANGKFDWKFVWLSEIKQGIDANGRHRGYEIVLADWLVQAAKNKKNLLTLSNDYFTLTGGLERWLYLWCRKAAGHQASGWTESFESLWNKSGVEVSYVAFCRKLRNLISKRNGELLDYYIEEVILGRKVALSVERLAQHQMRQRRLR